MPVDTALVVHTPSADQRVEDARARLQLARQRTRGTLSVLHRELVERTDWRTWYREHTGIFLTAAFVAGFLVAKRRR